jgi:hypothetical protein
MNDIDIPPAAPLPADLVAQVGQAMASAASRVQARWPDAPGPAVAELAQIEALGLQLQEAVRVLSGPRKAGLETVDLGVAALQSRAEWAGGLQRAEATWVGPNRGRPVQANPAVLKQLLDLAVGHALVLGKTLEMDVLVLGEPPLATLRLFVSRADGELFATQPGDADELHWVLLQRLARHTGVAAGRQVQARGVEITLGWPVPPAGH